MSSVQTAIQIFLELALISTVRVKGFTPTIHTQATIKLVCEYVIPFFHPFYFDYNLPQSYRSSSRPSLLFISSTKVCCPFWRQVASEMVLSVLSQGSRPTG
jgi:hypothetical protein